MAPIAWKEFIEGGKERIRPLITEKPEEIPNRRSQLPSDPEAKAILDIIRTYYWDTPEKFERCAVRIVQLMDDHFTRFKMTRPRRDVGGMRYVYIASDQRTVRVNWSCIAP